MLVRAPPFYGGSQLVVFINRDKINTNRCKRLIPFSNSYMPTIVMDAANRPGVNVENADRRDLGHAQRGLSRRLSPRI